MLQELGNRPETDDADRVVRLWVDDDIAVEEEEEEGYEGGCEGLCVDVCEVDFVENLRVRLQGEYFTGCE